MTPTPERWIHRHGFDREMYGPCCSFDVELRDGTLQTIKLTPARALELGRELVRYGRDYLGGALKTFARDAHSVQ